MGRDIADQKTFDHGGFPGPGASVEKKIAILGSKVVDPIQFHDSLSGNS